MSRTKFASLHSGLLARKGEALPASTHPLSEKVFTDQGPSLRRLVDGPLDPSVYETPGEDTSFDRNETQTNRAKPAYTPPSRRLTTTAPALRAPEPSVEMDEVDTEDFGPCETSCGAVRSAPSRAPRPRMGSLPFKLSVRVNARQRRLIRMIAAIRNQSQQTILAAAVDQYLETLGKKEMKSCRCYKNRLKEK